MIPVKHTVHGHVLQYSFSCISLCVAYVAIVVSIVVVVAAVAVAADSHNDNGS